MSDYPPPDGEAAEDSDVTEHTDFNHLFDGDFDAWMQYGIDQGWSGPAVCSTHDGIPTSEAEDEEFEEGDPCVHIIRLYESRDVRDAVEANHSPSNWRKP